MSESKANTRWRTAILLFVFWTLVGLIFAALSYASAIGARRPYPFSSALRFNVVYFYLWGVLSLLIVRFSDHFPVEFRPLNLRNLLFHIPAILLFASIHQVIHLAVIWFVIPGFKEQLGSFAELYRGYFAFGLYIDLIVASLVAVAAHAFIYYQDFRAAEVQQSKLQEQLAQAQLQTLKMQLHPHFLFNTLHSISSLVLEDPAKASEMIARLGDFLRLTLEHSADQMVTLRQEIEFLRCYLEIEQVRFEDRLTVDFQIEPITATARVPHLILQPIVENAIRYAIAPRAAPGRIFIAAARTNGSLRLAVSDSGPGIKTNGNAFEQQGVGLGNVRARLKQIYGKEFSFQMVNITGGGLNVIVEIPFRAEIP